MSEWCYAQMKSYTIDSRSESLQQTLHDISPADAKGLREKGWRYPKQVLHNWKDAEKNVRPAFQERIHRRLELACLLHMGTANARLLENAGIDSREELCSQNPDALLSDLIRINDRLGLRRNPLPKRRVIAWINAARRESAFY
ncbi:MAG: DUF4332 domain-containing protein [Deltaproteobacteria bacterium]|nr:DUF4332 domain-containing protein [Deltaproteobacteria bacterium]